MRNTDYVEINPNDERKSAIPPYVSFTDYEWLIINEATDNTGIYPENTIYDVKCVIGHQFSNKVI